MPYYKIQPDAPPPGVLHRVLCTRTDLYAGSHVIETKDKLDGYEEADAGPLGDTSACVAEWVTVDEPKDDLPAYEAAIAAAAEQYLKPDTRAVMKPAVEATVATVKVDTGVKEEPIGGALEVGRG